MSVIKKIDKNVCQNIEKISSLIDKEFNIEPVYGDNTKTKDQSQIIRR